ncbi:ABC transporter permease [Fulvivirgaceae bacterium BMA10]|uniref:ABC transporter permease n=1 Tax=Splendidivirga corallicola TaxID=3051826 RepID=A0ABT8KJU9_9BACT|nr:ABC transporter permease [Fulvivirgaceae bacterium BMA10]
MKEQKNIPPKLADRFLSWFCKGELLEEIQGDLHEYYEELIERSKWKRNLLYWFHVFNFLRPFAIKRSRSNNSNYIVMLQHNFKIARRSLLKQKMYSAIKIGSFSLGIAACFLIALFIQDELSYDKHYVDGDRIYRLINVNNDPESSGMWTAFPAPITAALKDNFPEIDKAGRLVIHDWHYAGSNQFRKDNQLESAYEEGFAYADPEIIDILQIPMVYGSSIHALSEPNSIVLSKRKADNYFPNENPVGKVIILNEDESRPFVVGGVMESFPSNSHLKFDFIISLTDVEFWPGEQTNWCCFNYRTYIRVKPETDPKQLEEKLLYIRDNYMVPHLEEAGSSYAEIRQKYHSFLLQPVSDIHLKSQGFESEGNGDIRVVWLFGTIAGFILLLACINFVNLSTAKSANRAKEVGLRKVVGSYRFHLIYQFLTESFLTSLISCVIAILMAWMLLPYFNELSGKSLTFPWGQWLLIPTFGLFIIFIGIFSGIYPSLYLSAFKPIDVLKGSLSQGSKSSKMRSTLVIFQFTISSVLIICTLLINQQMGFILTKKIGFDKEQVVMIQGANTLADRLSTFKNELLTLSEVKNVTISDYLPISSTRRNQNPFWKDGKSKIDQGIDAQIWQVDQDYINTMGMKLLQGRGFSSELVSDSSAVIINQTMAKELGLENPIGKRIMNWQTWTVIGVVEDFHFQSLKRDIGSLCLVLGNSNSIVSVKIQTENMASMLHSITDVWDQFMPNQPMRYTFLDESYASMYEDVKWTGKVLSVFTALAIIVACLGLFALSAFMVEQRSKEISIRKILGASLSSIFSLLTFNFLKLVLIALVIAIPLGWYVINRWLEDYANRIEITWEVFVIAGIIAVLIALLTISSESIKAALVNPARKLRSE